MKIKIHFFVLLIAKFTFADAQSIKKMNTTVNSTIRYVALGDSYTICEGATTEESWPFLLTKHLNDKNIPVELIANPSVTGWTTQDLIDKELSIYDASNPDFATLLIGVNDWVQKVTDEQFEKNLKLILDRMQAKLSNKSNLVLITIPDFVLRMVSS